MNERKEMNMAINCFPLGFLETNCYILHHAGEAVVVDPGASREEGLDHVLRFLEDHALRTVAIFCTHLHFDHVTGVAELAQITNAPIYGGKDDLYLLDDSASASWGFPPVPHFTPHFLHEGPSNLGPFACQVLSTPGHTPGSFSLYISSEQALMSGDLLFRRSVGRTDLPGGNSESLRASITDKIFTLPADTVVYPGHGPETTVGDEATYNPYL